MPEDTSHEILVALTGIIGLGIGAQWLAWRLRLPSILLLLVCGFIAGPITGFLDPEALLGPAILPVASLAVAVILFEGGMSLKLSELSTIGKDVRNLIVLGGLLTWGLTTAAAYWILDFDARLATLFGAILDDTGPTVVLPLLRHVQPSGRVRSLLKWEGILNDPVGAVLAVLVFEALFLGFHGNVTTQAATGLLYAIFIGVAFGCFGAAILLVLLKKYWIPDSLQSAASLMAVVVAFTASNHVQPESGLLTVTIMGLLLANQRSVAVKHIIEFKENLRVLLISGLFIVLSARLPVSAFEEFNAAGLLFLACLILVVRPVAVFVSTCRSTLGTPEKAFVSWMAPRGVVAAAVASVFALRLDAMEYPGAERLVPVTFLVIIGTISVYGLTAHPLACRLRVANPRPQGVLFIGAHLWARSIAKTLVDCGVEVLMADTNRSNILEARRAGLRTYFGNVVSDHAHEDIDLDGIGRLIALTANDEANSLAVLHYAEVFSRKEVYQLATNPERWGESNSARHLRGRRLFGEEVEFSSLADRFLDGAVVKAVQLTPEFGFGSVRKLHGIGLVPLFVVTDKGEVRVFNADSTIRAEAGHRLVCIVDEVESESSPGDGIVRAAECVVESEARSVQGA